MATQLTAEDRLELRGILSELETRKPEDSAKGEEFQQILKELGSHASEEKEKQPLGSQVAQTFKELPTNVDIGFTNLGASALNAMASRGIQLNFTAMKSLGFSNEEVMSAMNPTDEEASQRQRVAQEIHKFATDVEGPVSTHPLGFVFGLADEVSKTFRPQAKKLEARAQKMAEELPEASFTTSPVLKAFRSAVQSGVPSLAAAAGATILTGSPAVGLAVLGETTQGQEFFDQIEGGASIPKATTIAAISAGVEIATESITFPKVLHGFAKGGTLTDGIRLALENSTQEGVAAFSQTFVSQYGILTSQGMNNKKAGQEAFEAGVKAIPEGMVVGAMLGGGSVAAGKAASIIRDRGPKVQKPGSVTEEAPKPSTNPVSQDTTLQNQEDTSTAEPIVRAQNFENKNTERVIAEGQGLDQTVKPPDLLAAEISDQTTGQTEKTETRSREWGRARNRIDKLQTELGLDDSAYRKILFQTTEKNSTTAMSLPEMALVEQKLIDQKSGKQFTDDLERLQFTPKEITEIKNQSSKSSVSDDSWKRTVNNIAQPLPQDPFARRKMFNDIKTSVKAQDTFTKRKKTQTDIDKTTFQNKKAVFSEKTQDFFGNWSSFRNVMSDIEQQSGVPIYDYFNNLVDSRAKAVGDSDRAFTDVLKQHGYKHIPFMSNKENQRVNRALYFGEAEDIQSLSPKEKQLYDASRDMFNTDPERVNTGPNAIRLRSWQWKNWNDSYNKLTPKISELEATSKSATTEAKDLRKKLDKKEADHLTELSTLLETSEQRLIEVDQAMVQDMQRPEGSTEELTQEQFALLVRERTNLPSIIEQTKKDLKKGIGKDPLKKSLGKNLRTVRTNKRNIKRMKTELRNSRPVQGLGEGKRTRTPDAQLLQGKKAMEEGRYYDWLRKQTFGTRDIYFVNDEAFDQWFKTVNDQMKPGELDKLAPTPNTSISDVAQRSRVQEGSPLLNQNPLVVARNRLTKLAMLDELYHPLQDMKNGIQPVWDTHMTSGQRRGFKTWMDNMTGIYDDSGVLVNATRVVQRQWWRAKGWTPQFIAKFAARNIFQNALAVGQVNTTAFGKAAPKAYASQLLQQRQQLLEKKKKAGQEITPAEQKELQDSVNNLRKELIGGIETEKQLDPFLQEDWMNFATFEVSQKAAQFNMLMQRENGVSPKSHSRYTALLDVMPGLMASSDTLNRYVTYLPLHQMAFDSVRDVKNGKIQMKQLWSRLSLDTLESPQRRQLINLLEKGDERSFIRQYANMKTKNIHYAYDLTERSSVEQKAAGRLVAGVITWPRSALENYVRLHKQGVAGLQEGDISKAWTAYNQFSSYMGMFGFLGWATKELVGEQWYGILQSINPINWFGSPQLQFIEKAQRSLQTFTTSFDLVNGDTPSDEQLDQFISNLIDTGGTMLVPAAIGMLEGYKTIYEMNNNRKAVNSVELIRDNMLQMSYKRLGSREKYEQGREQLMKAFFNVEPE